MDNRKPIDNVKLVSRRLVTSYFLVQSRIIFPVLKDALDALKTPWLGLVHTSFPFCDHY